MLGKALPVSPKVAALPKMSMPTAAPGATARFEELVPGSSDVTVRKMFGQPAAFARGNLFFGVFGDQLFVRLGPEGGPAALRTTGSALFEPMPGRPMAGYIVLPPPILRDTRAAKEWVARSLAYALTLPAKGPAVGRTAPGSRGLRPRGPDPLR